MRSLLKWTLRALAMLILAAAVLGVWKRDEIARLLAVNSLFAADRIVGNFSGMDRLFLTVPMARGAGPVAEFGVVGKRWNLCFRTFFIPVRQVTKSELK